MMKIIIISTLAILYAAQSSYAANITEWLESHNTRRKKYHEANNKTVVDLKWSTGLYGLAKQHADESAQNCARVAYTGDYGFNGAQFTPKNLTAESALNIWEGKMSSGYPDNGAITQAIWRATRYVGCYTAVNDVRQCSVAICLYAKPGNCNMVGASGLTTAAINKWKNLTYADYSVCTPACPPEGCEPTPMPTRKPTKTPTTTEPTTSKPTTLKPTTKEPTTKKPTTSKPTTSKPTTSKPTTKKPTTKKPTTKKPTTKKPTTKKPTTSKPTTSKPTTKKPTTKKPTTSKPTTKNPTTKKPTTKKPTTKKPTN